jgi:hypothetical protein
MEDRNRALFIELNNKILNKQKLKTEEMLFIMTYFSTGGKMI